MNKEKCIFCFEEKCICQKIINEYNKKRNKEITEEHLYNIEKLREEFKQKVINEYKKNLISSLNIISNSDIEQYNSSDIIKIWIKKIENGEFD